VLNPHLLRKHIPHVRKLLLEDFLRLAKRALQPHPLRLSGDPRHDALPQRRKMRRSDLLDSHRSGLDFAEGIRKLIRFAQTTTAALVLQVRLVRQRLKRTVLRLLHEGDAKANRFYCPLSIKKYWKKLPLFGSRSNTTIASNSPKSANRGSSENEPSNLLRGGQKVSIIQYIACPFSNPALEGITISRKFWVEGLSSLGIDDDKIDR
jgi:hypothetical protein